jgi:hypothetical protein
VLIEILNLYAAETVYPVELPIELPTFLKIPKYHLERSSTSEMDDIFNLTSTITATDTALFQLIQSHWETEDEQLALDTKCNACTLGIECGITAGARLDTLAPVTEPDGPCNLLH